MSRESGAPTVCHDLLNNGSGPGPFMTIYRQKLVSAWKLSRVLMQVANSSVLRPVTGVPSAPGVEHSTFLTSWIAYYLGEIESDGVNPERKSSLVG